MSDQSKPPLLGMVKDAEKHFLSERRHRGDDLESALRVFLEFLRGFEQLAGSRFDNGRQIEQECVD